jgi:hypothetical protein
MAGNVGTWIPEFRGCTSCMSVEGAITSVTTVPLECDCVYQSYQQSHRVATRVQALCIWTVTAAQEEYRREHVRSRSCRNPKAGPPPPWNEELHTCMSLQLEVVSYKLVLAAWTNLNLSALLHERHAISRTLFSPPLLEVLLGSVVPVAPPWNLKWKRQQWL